MAAKTENERIQIHVYNSHRGAEVVMHKKIIPDDRAAFAMELMSKHALAAAAPNGEDTAGRQALRLQTPEEIVAHCCTIAHQAFNEFAVRGWLVAAPTLPEPQDRNSWAEIVYDLHDAYRAPKDPHKTYPAVPETVSAADLKSEPEPLDAIGPQPDGNKKPEA